MNTTAGAIDLRLYDDTPKHKENFLKLVKEHRYDSLLFHRVIKDFMIQGGDPDSKKAEPGITLGEGTLGYKLPAEITFPLHYHKRGAVAMAREGDETNPDFKSDACQFYIVWGKRFSTMDMERLTQRLDSASNSKMTFTPEQIKTYRKIGGSPHLDGAYTVFGEVIEGMEVVEEIQRTNTDDYDRPIDDVRIIKARVITSK
jgi:peptidyl-prolyl cis-trans isomerase B (cyclophilin B)